ncbi:MAG: four helix bundle protein [Candidatus Dojkabacteria bacterium]
MSVSSTNSYKDLIVWQKSITLVNQIYSVTKVFPREELYGLTNQIRRASVSIPSNIAEGSRRGTRKDYANFLRISLGSVAELETQLIIAINLNFLDEDSAKDIMNTLDEIGKILNTIIKKLI